MINSRLPKFVVCALLALIPSSAQADILYDNDGGGANGESRSASDYFVNGGFQVFRADDFSITAESLLTGASWHGFYNGTSTPPSAGDDFELAFYADDGGTPDSLPVNSAFLAFDVDVTRVESAVDGVFLYTSEFPPILWTDPSTTWLSIRNRTPDENDGDWGWLGVQRSGGNNAIKVNDEDWRDSGGQWRDFVLTGTAVPEPSSFGLIVLAFVVAFVVVAARRRR